MAYVLNNVVLSKGEGCIPGFIGIGVGGYVSEAMTNAKNAAFRELSGKNSQNILGVEDEKVRVIQAVTGGGFGSKLDLNVQGFIGLALYHLKRPVRLKRRFYF